MSQLQYRKLGKTGVDVSALGFGIMRLPRIEGKVDRDKSFEMIDYAYENGVNYFDTAENYLSGESESVLGEAVKNYRDKINIATKVGIWHIKDGIQDVEKLIEGQLKRLKTDYIDFYMIHALTDKRWEVFKKIGIIDLFEKKKRQGIIKHYGFSYHGTADLFNEIVTEYDWEFAQIQMNYIDINMQAGITGLQHADNKGLGTIIMEPLRGGQLVNGVSSEVKSIFHNANPDKTLAQWGFEFLFNRKDVDIVLSGMNHIDQVKENIKIASHSYIDMLSKEETEALNMVSELYRKLIKVPCTTCRYCRICPQDIYIYDAFMQYNNAVTMDFESAKMRFSKNKDSIDRCIDCRKCVEVCPQGIDIPKVLKEACDFFK
jgi:predicted aldo/keto reductase-like oxidoreductase